MPAIAILKLCKKKKMQDLQKDIKPFPIPEKEGAQFLRHQPAVFLSPGKGNKATLFYFFQTLSVFLFGISGQRAKVLAKSGLTEIIHLMCTSAVWGQYPAFLNPEFPLGAPLQVNAMAKSLAVGSYSGLMVATSFVY